MKTNLHSLRSTFRVQLAAFAMAIFTAVAATQVQAAGGQTTKKVNVNTADLATLETLPGVSATVAQHIIDGRPYHGIDDLAKVKGLGKTKAHSLQSHVTFGSTTASTSTSSKSASSAQSKNSSTASTGKKVNVNTADLTTLETLPGVGSSTAQNIIDGRPYSSYSELEQVKGLSKTKVDSLRSHITLGSTTAAASHSKKSKSTSTSAAKASSTETPPTENETAQSENGKNQNQNTLAPTGRSSSGKLAAGETININTASADELGKLYGIGPTKAQAIIDYRNQHGDFQPPEDVMKVKGIKQGEFDKIKDNITVR